MAARRADLSVSAARSARRRDRAPARLPSLALGSGPGGLKRALASCPDNQRHVLARAIGDSAGNRALSRLVAESQQLMRTPRGPNDPRGYDDLASFQRGITVLSQDGARQAWIDAHPPVIYRLDRATGHMTAITHEEACDLLGITAQELLRRAGSAPVLILRNGRLSRSSQATVDQINAPASAPAVIRAGLERLQADARRFSGPFPSDYYVQFSRAVTEANLSRRRSDPDAAIDEVNAAYGTEDFAHGRAVLQLYEALVPRDDDSHFDKVQHFVRSMSMHYDGTGITTDVAQYGKEVWGEIKSLWDDSDPGFDWADMRANNRGQAYAIELYRRFHPVRDVLLNPTTIPARAQEAGTRAAGDLERGIRRLYGLPW